ncbi:MAG: PVC-type heme-binding CxxCH protein, partial [Bacteroidota bacterium]
MIKKTIGILFCLLLLAYCKESVPVVIEVQEDTTRVVGSDAFGDEQNVAVTLADGFELKLWAPGPLLSNAVAISFDNNGVAYVAETSRRKTSDIDIREHRDWITDDLSLQSLEDTERFHKEKMAPELSAQNTWQPDFNEDGSHDYRDLEVQSEYIRRVWDADGDGRADHSKLFADGINDMLTGVGAGVLYHEDEVYLTAAPDLFKLKDLNGDGVADEKKSISHGYGIHIAYAGHDMSGLTVGPDGRIYWSVGDIGVNVTNQEGRHFKYPNQGAVMRCDPDGSNMEVFARGLRNPQEIAFNAWGDLLSVDNDGDHAGEHERYVHILEGSDSGWRINWQFGKYDRPNEGYKIWMDEKLYLPHFKGQAAYLLPPLALASDGPAGIAYNPGTALGEKWQDYFFVSYFKGSAAKSKTQAFRLKPNGSSYTIDEELDVITGIAATGVNFAPDGALYLNDWKDGYALKPEGRIWKLDVAADTHPLRSNTQQLLQSGMQEKKSKELSSLLAHEDMRVRLAAQFELVKRKDVKTLLESMGQERPVYSRLHAIWGFGQLARQDATHANAIVDMLQSDHEHLRAQAAKVLGDARYADAAEALLQVLQQDASVKAKFHAVEALGKLGEKKAFQPMVDLLAAVGETDPHFRHAITYALSQLDCATELASLHQHPSVDVRVGATVALRHMASPLLAAFLQDKNERVATEAARGIHDDFSVPEAMEDLAKALNESAVKTEAFLRRAINANLRIGDAESAARLSRFTADRTQPEAMRADAMWALGYWQRPPVLDRVDGRYRQPASTQLADTQKEITPHVNTLLSEKNTAIKIATVALIGRALLPEHDAQLLTFVKSKQHPV